MKGCYLCNSESLRERPGKVRDNDRLKVLECNDCGLVFLSSFEHIQDSHYEQSGMHGNELPNVTDWLIESDADDERRFNFLKPRLIRKELLDFGCGAGGFLSKARYFAANVVGLEPESRLQEHFSKSGLTVYPLISDLFSSGLKFDLITAFHVVEHLPDPRSILSQLAELLKSGGQIVVEVPNSDDALLTLFECKPFMGFTYWSQHLFLFNGATLTKLVRQAGLKVFWIKFVQRYSLSNHLYWLAKGKPGGHKEWAFLDDHILNQAYSSQLAAMGKCDTLIAGVGKL